MPTAFSKGDILIERVRLIDFFDSGGQAEIWRVEDLDFSEHLNLALKLRHVPWDERSDPEFRKRDARLEYEVKLLGNCPSTYIVAPSFKVEGRAETEGGDRAFFGLVMDFAPDGSLDRFFGSEDFRRFTAMDRVALLRQMALGVQSMQHWEIVHNDIKPQNILIFREAHNVHPRFADFGYAFRRTEPPVHGGTAMYMAPELVLRECDPSFRTDIFSLGIVFYETMMGFHPLVDVVRSRDPLKALQGYYSTQNYIDFSEAHRRTGRPLVELIERMCARDPEMRPDIADVLDELTLVIQNDPSWNSVDLQRYFPEMADRYRWADAMHQLFGEEELLIFLRGSNRESDAQSLGRWLNAEKLFGFSIMRLLGAYDYLLRIWRRPGERASLDAVLDRFKSERGPYVVFEPRFHWPPSPSVERLGVKQRSDALSLLDGIARGRVAAKRRGSVIVGESKRMRERDRASKAIRAICRVMAAKELSAELAEVIGERIHLQLSKVRGFGAVEVFCNPGGRSIAAEFVVIVEFQQFHRYRKVLDVIESTLGTLSNAPPSRSRTHFEMDTEAPFESYDGRLLYELFRYSRGRHKADEGGHDT